MNIGPGHHSVTITGRGIGADFYDSSADLLESPQLRGATINASNALELAPILAKPFGIACRSAVADLGVPILPFSIGLVKRITKSSSESHGIAPMSSTRIRTARWC